jgi:hypothetical protein
MVIIGIDYHPSFQHKSMVVESKAYTVSDNYPRLLCIAPECIPDVFANFELLVTSLSILCFRRCVVTTASQLMSVVPLFGADAPPVGQTSLSMKLRCERFSN